MTAAPKSLATFEALLALEQTDPEGRYEILAGEVVPKASPSPEHSDAQTGLGAILRGPFHRRPGGPDGPGGWWLLVEVDIELTKHDLVRPDIAGWRRERVSERLTGRPVRIPPDWICEVVSPSNARRDRVQKLELYRKHGVSHYWLVDPTDESLVVHRLTPEGYLVVLTATRADVVRAEPFDAIELRVGLLFGDE